MSSKFTEIAKRQLGGSEVLSDRTKITIEEVIDVYPDGVLVDEFDILHGDKGPYPVFHIAGTDNYFNGGALALKVAQGWADAFGGDIAAASAELKSSGGCKFAVFKGKTRNGNTITRFDPIG